MSEQDVIARVWREAWGQWWAEVWRPRRLHDPPPPDPVLTPADWPDPIPGYTRIDLTVNDTRRGARKSAARMAARYRAGLHPTVDKPQPEIVETV